MQDIIPNSGVGRMPGSSPGETETDEVVQAKSEEVKDVKGSSEESSAPEKGEKSLVESVKDALDAQKEKAPASDEQGSKPEDEPAADAKKEGDEAAPDSDDLTEEELARLRPKTRKRIENLLADRNERDRRIAEISPKAEQFDKIVGFVDEAGLTKDEVNRGFAIMADLKNDPLRAYEALKPVFAQLQILVGDVLPEDLQTEVVYGRITEAHARELARARSRTAVTERQLQRRDQRSEQERQQQAYQGLVQDVSSKVSEWERAKAKTDPDWKLKSPRVTQHIELEIARRQRNQPDYFPTVEEALKFAEDAATAVENEFKALAPRRREVKPAVTDGASTRSTPKPTSALEAAKMGLARMSAG